MPDKDGNKKKPEKPWYQRLFDSGAAAKAGEAHSEAQRQKQDRLDEITGKKPKK